MTGPSFLAAPAESRLPAVFLRYQQQLMVTVSIHAVTVIEKSRRTGYSWAAAAVAVITAAAKPEAKGMDVFYIGYNLEIGREFIDCCAEWAKAIEPAAAVVLEHIFTDPDNPEKEIKTFRVEFASGHKIVALPSLPRALRGMQGLVIIDEAAFHDDLKELLKAALALLIWGGKVLIISTHDGVENPFNELISDIRAARKNFALLRCTFDDALDDGLYKRICLVKGTPWSPEAEAVWRQEIIDFYGDGAEEELFCVPSNSAGRYLPLAQIERAAQEIPIARLTLPDSFAELPEHLREAEIRDWCETVLKPLLKDINPALRSYLGVDFARSGDLSVFWPLQIMSDLTRRPPFVVELRNVPFEQQKQILFYLCDRLPLFTNGAFDATGNGAYLAEVAAQRYGFNRIQQIKLSVKFYQDNMPRFKAGFEDGKIIIPKDNDTVSDHRAIHVKSGVAHIQRDSVDGKKRHGDSAVANFLGYTASYSDVVEYDYQPAMANDAPGHDEVEYRTRQGFGQGSY
jgi:phage FluMu gp28-like protein